MSATTPASAGATARRGRAAFLIPLTVFALVAVVLGIGLFLDPRKIPSPLIGKPAPVFSLPAVRGRHAGLSSADLKGQVSLVNVFASWCVACREEHPVIVALSKRNILPIYGLNYKDKPDDAAAWLDKWGDPYARTGADVTGRVGIDWGVYGVPETFVVAADGRIAHKHIGPMTDAFVSRTLLPMVERLRQGTFEAGGAFDSGADDRAIERFVRPGPVSGS